MKNSDHLSYKYQPHHEVYSPRDAGQSFHSQAFDGTVPNILLISKAKTTITMRRMNQSIEFYS
jgi:hypothetical protein